MKTKKLAIVSGAALTAGLAHGAITYTYSNQTVVPGVGGLIFDLDQDGTPDYLVNFYADKATKPYISDSASSFATSQPYVLSDATDNGGATQYGLPVTPAGTTIDGSYESQQTTGIFYQNAYNNTTYTIGAWESGGTNIEGYVGLELIDASANLHYGWAHFIYNSTNVYAGVTGTITLVDYAVDTVANESILAAQNDTNGLPSFVIPPASQTNNVLGTAQFRPIAKGFPAPTYRWMAGAVGSGVYTNLSDGGGISGSTSNVLTIANLAMANQADYVLVLSNANGSVTNSAPATLTVLPLTISGISPSPVELFSGRTASLHVTYVSSAPAGFQWLKNGTRLVDGGKVSGSTSSNLVIGPLTGSDAANYSVIVTNMYGAVTSRVDAVSVIMETTAYQQWLATIGPAAYYSLDETNDPASGAVAAFDYFGGLTAIYGAQVQNGNPTNNSIVGPRLADGFAGFSQTNTAMVPGTELQVSSYVQFPPLNLNTNTVTFTAWIYPSTTEPNWATIISTRAAAAGTANGMNYSGAGTLGYHWNDNGNTYNYNSMLVPAVGQWSFVAVAVAPSNAVCYIFDSTGASMATNSFSNDYTHPVQALDTPGYIGGDKFDPNFIGSIDEVAIFNQTLTFTQLTNLYSAAVTGNPPPSTVVLSIRLVGGNIEVSWSPEVGTLKEAPSLAGPWTTDSTVSPYQATPTSAQKFYRVQIQ